MGKPRRSHVLRLSPESIGWVERTEGSEPSQYLEEEKTIVIPSVAASEHGRAQTGGSDSIGVVGLPQGAAREVSKPGRSRRLLERTTIEGDSPVGETGCKPRRRNERGSLVWFLSTTGHVEPCGNLGGPSSKAKDYSVTDSELVP